MASNVRDIEVWENTVKEIQLCNQGIVELRRTKKPCNHREIFELIHIIYVKMRDEMTIYEEHYLELERNFSNIPTTSTNLLLRNIYTYSKNLKELIKTFRITSRKLDNISMIAESVSLLSSLFSLTKNIDTIFNNEMSINLTNQAYDTHPVLGMISQLFWNCVPQSIYLRFLTSIGQRIGTWWALRKLLKTSQACKESLAEIKDFFTESKEMNEEVKNAYFSGWDDKLVDLVEKTVSDYSASAKTFIILYVLALIGHPFMLQRFDFLTKIFTFSTSTLGEKWYRRNLIQDLFPKITIETGKIDLIDLTDLSKSSTFLDSAMLPETAINILESGSKTTVNDRLHVETKSATPFVYATLDCILIYFSYRELMYGVNNKNSILFRNLASSSEIRLQKINSFMLKCVSRRLAIEG